MIPKTIPLKNEQVFRLALRHSSAAQDPVADSYERLEFFGDSVLGLVVAQYLYEHHPSWDQGMLSKAKSSVVQESPLARVAQRLGLEPLIELNSGEEATGGRNRASILADVVEAIIGGIYLESGLEVARWFVLEQLHADLMRVSSGDVNPDDFKSKLQEVAHRTWKLAPQYRVVKEEGLAHRRRYVVQVTIGESMIGEGEGRNKKEAEQMAARDALEIIKRNQADRPQQDDRFGSVDFD